MIITLRLANKPITSQSSCVCVCVCVCVCGESIKIYYFCNFHEYNTVLLTVVTMLYTTSPELIHLITGSFYLLTNISPLPPNSSSLW